MEGPIFGGAYVRREICVSKSIRLACSGKEIYHFRLVLLCIRGQIPSTSPRGAYIRRGDLTEGFLRYDFGGLIFGGAYTWRGFFSEFYGITLAGLAKLTKKGLEFPFDDKYKPEISFKFSITYRSSIFGV